MGDIYCLFYELGIKILKKHGILAFITSNKWMRSGYGEKLRDFFAKHANPLRLLDFAGYKVFDSATVDVNIMVLEKNKNKGCTVARIIRDTRITEWS
jgi:type II restriction/modification system DNA methylase subunit YeeA